MNPLTDIPTDIPIPSAATKAVTQLDTCIRQHPGGTLLAAAGFGVAVLLLARALTPTPPRNRAMRLLEDIQHRLSGLADDSVHAVDKSMDSLGHLHLDRKLDRFSRSIKGLFH